MQSESPVEIADRLSRRRAIGVAIAAIAFLAVQVIAPPFFFSESASGSPLRATFWAANAVVLFLLLATRGGLIYGQRVRSLVNDDVTRGNHRSAVTVGYWVAMAVALGVFAAAGRTAFTAREAVYLIVTPSIAAALLFFSWLERRALRDA